MEKPQATFHRDTTQRPNVGRVCVLSYYNSPLSFVGQGWGRLPLSFPGNTPCSPCHSMATGQTASDRIVCLHRRGNKDQGESGADKETHPLRPLALPSRGRLSLYWHPDPDSKPEIHFPCSAADCHRPQTDRAACRKSNIHRQAVYKKNLSRNFNQRELLESTDLAPKLLLLPFMLINVDLEIKSFFKIIIKEGAQN